MRMAAPHKTRTTHTLYVRAPAGLRLREKKVERLVRKMRGVMPWLEPSDFPACRAWAELETLAAEVYSALRTARVLNVDGDARRLLDDYRKLRQTQVVLSRELGMTPAARLSLKSIISNVALDLAAMAAPEDAEIQGDAGGEPHE
jgi:hypothetical protein